MRIALIDNGSLEAAAHRTLRTVAAGLSDRTGLPVDAVSWKHSDQIEDGTLDRRPIWTLRSWLKANTARGEREFLFVPYFISAQGAIGSLLRRDIEAQQRETGGFRFKFSAGLAALGALPQIVASRIRATIAQDRLVRPPVVIVDHGGPSEASALVRNEVARRVESILDQEIRALTAASMEGEEHAHNLPLFGDVLATTQFGRGDVIVSPLFLSPGRHAGANGDLAQIATAAEDRVTGDDLHCHFTDLVGTHPDVVPALADGLVDTLATFHAAA